MENNVSQPGPSPSSNNQVISPPPPFKQEKDQLPVRKKLTNKTLIFIAYFIILFILHQSRFFNFSWLFLQNTLVELIFWCLGAILGLNFLKIDQMIYVYFTHPELVLSQSVRTLISSKKIKEAFKNLSFGVEEQRLAFRSAIFQAIWCVLAFFTLTSTSGVFGKTLVMGLGLSLLLDEWRDFLTKGRNINWLFWQIKRIITPQEQKWFLGIMTGMFGILSLLLI